MSKIDDKRDDNSNIEDVKSAASNVPLTQYFLYLCKFVLSLFFFRFDFVVLMGDSRHNFVHFTAVMRI